MAGKSSKLNFKIREANHYEAPLLCEDCEPPVRLGHFSINSENQFCDDDHQKKYLKLPRALKGLNKNLNAGASKLTAADDEEASNIKLLKWLVSHKSEVENLLTQKDSSNSKVDFICGRSVLKAISLTLREKKYDWLIYATKFRSVIYLCKITSKEGKKEETSRDPGLQSIINMGYAFEGFITSASSTRSKRKSCELESGQQVPKKLLRKTPEQGSSSSAANTISGKKKSCESEEWQKVNKKPRRKTPSEQDSSSTANVTNTSTSIDAISKYYVVMNRKFGDHDVLFSAEIDAVDDTDDSVDTEDSFVEIKTHFELDSDRRVNSFKANKLPYLHMQCFIAGIPRVVMGFRNKDGFLQEIKLYKISDLPGIANDKTNPFRIRYPPRTPRSWRGKKHLGLRKPEVSNEPYSPDACLNFLNCFLNHIKQCVVKDDPKVVYKFYFKPGETEITCEERDLRNAGLSNEWSLPEWYITKMSPP